VVNRNYGSLFVASIGNLAALVARAEARTGESACVSFTMAVTVIKALRSERGRSLMQNAGNQNAIKQLAVKHDVRAVLQSAQARTNIAAVPS
jgi:hypothetical protein